MRPLARRCVRGAIPLHSTSRLSFFRSSHGFDQGRDARLERVDVPGCCAPLNMAHERRRQRLDAAYSRRFGGRIASLRVGQVQSGEQAAASTAATVAPNPDDRHKISHARNPKPPKCVWASAPKAGPPSLAGPRRLRRAASGPATPTSLDQSPPVATLLLAFVPWKRPKAGPAFRCRCTPPPPPAQPHRPSMDQSPPVVALPLAFVPWKRPKAGPAFRCRCTPPPPPAQPHRPSMDQSPPVVALPLAFVPWKRPKAGPAFRCRCTPPPPPAQPHRPRWTNRRRSLRSFWHLFHGSAPKPVRRFAAAARRLRLRPSHTDLPWTNRRRSLRSLWHLFHGSAPKPVRRFAAAARRLRLRPSHTDLPWTNRRRSLRSRHRLFHGRANSRVKAAMMRELRESRNAPRGR